MIERGIQFDDIHSYYDLNLFLSGSKIPPAIPKTNYIELAGGDSVLDLTEAHGEVKFNDRDCEFTFTMNPSGGLKDEDFEAKKTEVSNALNGKRFNKITLDKDSDYYYTGRVTVNDYLSDRRLRQIVVTAKVKPYKYKQKETIVEVALTEEEQTVILKNSRKTVIPSFTCTDDNTQIVYGPFETVMNAGTHSYLDIQFKEGENVLKVSGSGTLTIKYQEADL